MISGSTITRNMLPRLTTEFLNLILGIQIVKGENDSVIFSTDLYTWSVECIDIQMHMHKRTHRQAIIKLKSYTISVGIKNCTTFKENYIEILHKTKI